MGNNNNSNNKQNNALCAGCMRAVKWIPVLFIVGVITWSYYAYVVQFCILTIEGVFKKAILLIFYHIICVLFFWSYWQTTFTPIGTVPDRWKVPPSEAEKLERTDSIEKQRMLEHFARDLPTHNRTINGEIRFCETCKVIKPDRAHHCTVCGTCVLKMDHHCPWVNNCINFTNYKYFLLFLGYSLIYCVYVALSSLKYFIKFWQGELDEGSGRFHIIFLLLLAVMFGLSLVSLFGYHLYLVLSNRTTIEAVRAPIFRIGGQNNSAYNIGRCANFKEVFGDNWKLWFIPVFTSRGDGFRYPMQRTSPQITSYESTGDTSTSFGDGTCYTIRISDDDTESLLGSQSDFDGEAHEVYAESGFNLNDNYDVP